MTTPWGKDLKSTDLCLPTLIGAVHICGAWPSDSELSGEQVDELPYSNKNNFLLHSITYINKHRKKNKGRKYLKFAGENTPIQSPAVGLSCSRSTLTHSVSSPCNKTPSSWIDKFEVARHPHMFDKMLEKKTKTNWRTHIRAKEERRSWNGGRITEVESDPVDGDSR